MRTPGWPAELSLGRVGLRPIRRQDAPTWREVRMRNAEWLRPWEATPPDGQYAMPTSPAAYTGMVRRLRRQVRDGSTIPFVVTYDGEFVGQLTIGSIVRGSLNSGYAGYWVDQRVAGRGVMPAALALAVDHCFGPVGLHRVEANVRPENTASRRVVEKLGFRDEGMRLRYLHIAGAYRDHICYALTVEDVAPEGLVARWLRVSGRSA
jgi:[ribosomal protein S5]-alanine N-acetyltransferase